MRALIESAQSAETKKITVKSSESAEGCAKAARKLVKNGVVIIRGNTNLVGFDEIFQQCLDTERRVCGRLDALGIRYKGEGLDKKERARLMEDERLQSFRFREVSSRCLGRLDMKLDDGVNIHEMQCPWINTVKSVLGDDCKLAYFGLISSFPQSWNQPFHGDGPHLFGKDYQLPPHALNVFVPLQDVTMDLGPTEFFSRSNNLETVSVLGKCVGSFAHPTQSTTLEAAKKCLDLVHVSIKPLLRASRDCLIYDFRTIHRGTCNTSTSGQVRRVLYLLYCKPWFTEDNINFDLQNSIFAKDASCLEALAKQRQDINCGPGVSLL